MEQACNGMKSAEKSHFFYVKTEIEKDLNQQKIFSSTYLKCRGRFVLKKINEIVDNWVNVPTVSLFLQYIFF